MTFESTLTTLIEEPTPNKKVSIDAIIQSYTDTMWALKTNPYQLIRVIDCHKIAEDFETLEIHYKNLKNGVHSWDIEQDFKKMYKKLGKCKYPIAKLEQMEREYTPSK